MATSVRLIRPVSSLAWQSNRHPLPALHHSLPATLLPIRRTFASTAIIKDKSNDNGIANNTNSIEGSNNTIKAKDTLSPVETESAEAAAAAERQRVIAQDATLKEILENAAAEKKKLEEELMRKQRLAAEQEQKRQAAIKEAAEAAQKAAAEAAARANAAAEAEKKQLQQKATKPSLESKQGPAVGKSVSESTLGSGTAAERLQQSLASSFKDSAKNATAAATSSTPPASSPANASAVGTPTEHSYQSAQRDNEFIEDPLEPFKARLLPYKKSLASSTEYIRSSLPDSLRQLQESVKRKDYRDLISQLSEHLNNFTGYTSINDLKFKVIDHGKDLLWLSRRNTIPK